MERKNIGYWAATGLFGLIYLGSGIADVLHASPVLATLAHLGFPAYLASILGPWKIAGVAALLAPGFPRLKEWAYAGIVFDLSSGALSHAINGDPTWRPLIPLVLLGLVAASYLTRPAGRRIEAGPARLEGVPRAA